MTASFNPPAIKETSINCPKTQQEFQLVSVGSLVQIILIKEYISHENSKLWLDFLKLGSLIIQKYVQIL